MRRRDALRFALAALSLACAGAATLGDPAPAPSPRTDWNPAGLRIELSLSQTGFEDGLFGATTTTGAASGIVQWDRSGAFYVGVGSFGPDGRPREGDLCSASVGSRPPGKDLDRPSSSLLASHPRVWWVVARPLPAEFGRVGLEATWSRWDAGDDGRPVRVAGGHRRLLMEEGASSALDLLRLPDDVAPLCATDASIHIGAAIPVEPGHAVDRLAFDLWLEHRDPGGETVRRRFRAEGSPGEAVAFDLEPIRLARARDGREVVLRAEGTLRARRLADGTVMVELRSSRSLDLERADRRESVNLGLGRGRKVFETALGKTVSVVLPDPTQTEIPYAPSADALILTVGPVSR